MKDQSVYSNGHDISEGLQNFIDSMVEEIVLEGRPFDTQKKYLKKFSEKEGLDYNDLENTVNDIIEVIKEWHSFHTKSSELMARMLAKKCFLSEKELEKLLSPMEGNNPQPGSDEEDDQENEGSKVSERPAYAYVDLGLPSGTLWATFNVGATRPEEAGDYFAWGETRPKYNYDWISYKYCEGYYDELTKYCFNSKIGYRGFTDKLFILLSVDDAAAVNWGEKWRMPVIEEWEELCENTSQMWTSLNGVKGCLFKARNGNSLFLPAVGFRDGFDLKDDGDEGSYWSSTGEGPRLSRYSGGGCSFGISTKDGGWRNYCSSERRCRGLSIRPVRSDTGIALKYSRKEGTFGKLSNIFRDYIGY